MASHLSRIFFALVIGSTACAGTRATGRAHELDAVTRAAMDLIEYRRLTASDFRAPEAPPEIRASKHEVGAYSCLTLGHEDSLAVIDVTERLSAPERDEARRTYRADLSQVAFQAYLDRGCSWINPQGTLPPDYVLEHEQLHFALFELEARRLNADPEAVRREVAATDSDPDVAFERAKVKLGRLLERSLVRLNQQNDDLDRETSFGHHPREQTQWRERVEAALDGDRAEPALPVPAAPAP